MGLITQPEHQHVPAPAWQASKPGPRRGRAIQRLNTYNTDCVSYRLQRRTVWTKVVTASFLEDEEDVTREGGRGENLGERGVWVKGGGKNGFGRCRGWEKNPCGILLHPSV